MKKKIPQKKKYPQKKNRPPSEDRVYSVVSPSPVSRYPPHSPAKTSQQKPSRSTASALHSKDLSLGLIRFSRGSWRWGGRSRRGEAADALIELLIAKVCQGKCRVKLNGLTLHVPVVSGK